MKKKELEERNRKLAEKVQKLESELKTKTECLDHLETAFALCKVLKNKAQSRERERESALIVPLQHNFA